jgi:hypothetical protein
LINPPADASGVIMEAAVFLLGCVFLGGIMWFGTGVREQCSALPPLATRCARCWKAAEPRCT